MWYRDSYIIRSPQNYFFFPIAESVTNIPVPIAAPVITRHVNSSSTRKLFTVNITSATPSSQAAEGVEEGHVPLQNVSYLYKVQQGSNISYIWQVRLTPAMGMNVATPVFDKLFPYH